MLGCPEDTRSGTLQAGAARDTWPHTCCKYKHKWPQRKVEMPDTVCKIIRQYNKDRIPAEDMQKLLEIARDYASVKNYVYQRYGGIRSLSKLYPGYTVQNEMTCCGLRESLGLPSVYFYLAIFDALRELRAHWTMVKTQVGKRVNAHEELKEEEKHFLRYLLKVNNAFDAALNGTEQKLPKEVQRQYDLLASQVDVKKLEGYLRRQVRKQAKKLHVEQLEGFSATERAYRYGDGGIYISVKQKRKRIHIPLTDGNQYMRQIYIRLFPERGAIEIRVPIDVTVKRYADHDRKIGLSMGMMTMLVTDEGHLYGERYGQLQSQLSDWLREQTSRYHRNREANPGRKKYQDQKHRMEEQLHSYINQELNRFFREERPGTIYLPKLPKGGNSGQVKKLNYMATTWQRGYIRNRLRQKCREQAVEFVEVFGKDISNGCSRCGAVGKKQEGRFYCPVCGYEAGQKVNAAQNAKKRGMSQMHGAVGDVTAPRPEL